jgi:CubicO group peptidase (beta-lactamase class C family)
MASAGKFITHIAALQCVERGLITLDEPVYSHLPELENLGVVTRNEGSDASSRPFLLRSRTKIITLRHLLSHSSGIDYESNPMVKEWRASTSQNPREDFHPIIDPESDNYTLTAVCSTPLLFEPGEGWMYGASIEWTALLVVRLTKQRLEPYTQENIFKPLGMTSSTYHPQGHPDILSRLLKMVRRDGDRLLPVNYTVRDLVSSAPDIATLLTDLISTTSKLLKKEHIDLLFLPQFAPSSAARTFIRRDTENYAAPAGIPSHMTEAPVNHSLAALVVEEALPLSHMPAGTVTWNGMPNLIWAMHKEKGLGVIFATQLLPVDDEKTVDLAMTFMREVWERFG